jgi:LmbE family N-acetylglucosaminyl deacetylase
MPDSGLHDAETQLVTELTAHASQGIHIIAPWAGDFHPDHEVCGRAARAVAAETGALLTSYFFWTWHRGTPATLDGLNLVKFPLDGQGLACKNPCAPTSPFAARGRQR